MLSEGVGVGERSVDPRSRCWSKERHSVTTRHRIGRRLGLPVVALEFAVVDSQDSVVGASRGTGSLSPFLQGIAG